MDNIDEIINKFKADFNQRIDATIADHEARLLPFLIIALIAGLVSVGGLGLTLYLQLYP